MPDGTPQEREAAVTVREFASANETGLNLEILLGGEGMANEIRSPRIQKLGLALAGFTGYIHSDRVQVMGASEIDYLKVLDPDSRVAALERLAGLNICCIVLLKGLEAPEGLLTLGQRDRIPILRTEAVSSLGVARITDYLDGRLAPRTTVHGVFVEVFELGVLLLGPSGIGKSECALELILKGHRLIADDSVEFTRRGTDRLIGAAGEVLPYHIELRGLGVIDVKELFGISATGRAHSLDLAVRLERWRPDAEYDRLGLDQSFIGYLGVPVPLILMPVAPGRNVATLVEIAARIQLLRQRGYQPSRELLAGFQRAPHAEKHLPERHKG
jgi:HPr kinase/phosphorylase